MYAVIKTGGKQYRVQPGDLLVVEKLEGEVGSEIAFDQVLMLGDDGATHIGGPVIEGAVVRATLIETRKGDKVKVFKKIRRQGYRRTRGHRQLQTVLRVTGLEGAGKRAAWDGEVDLTPLATLRLRARGLAPVVASEPVPAADLAPPAPEAAAPAKAAPKRKPAPPQTVVAADVADEQSAAEVPPEASALGGSVESVSPIAPDVVDEQAAAEAPPKAARKASGKKAAAADPEPPAAEGADETAS
jgi:large subunit ribosomal protein L21